jgi:hypothetical protein
MPRVLVVESRMELHALYVWHLGETTRCVETVTEARSEYRKECDRVVVICGSLLKPNTGEGANFAREIVSLGSRLVVVSGDFGPPDGFEKELFVYKGLGFWSDLFQAVRTASSDWARLRPVT